jgi:hypothetical protein
MAQNILTASLGRNIITVEGNGLAIFVDDTDFVLKLKDVDGNIQAVSDFVGSSGTSGGGIQSINALTASAQFMTTGTSGTDFAVQSSGNTHTFNLPDASTSARGLVSTGAQTIKGVKTFTDNSFFQGDVDIAGTLTAEAKSFLIPHPDPDKQGWDLQHGNLEGGEHAIYHRGRLQGTNMIYLPSYWKFLVSLHTISVHLTSAKGDFNYFVEDVTLESIRIAKPVGDWFSYDCYFIIHAERRDIGKLKVEITPQEKQY